MADVNYFGGGTTSGTGTSKGSTGAIGDGRTTKDSINPAARELEPPQLDALDENTHREIVRDTEIARNTKTKNR